jgi:hypothetical protein
MLPIPPSYVLAALVVIQTMQPIVTTVMSWHSTIPIGKMVSIEEMIISSMTRTLRVFEDECQTMLEKAELMANMYESWRFPLLVHTYR